MFSETEYQNLRKTAYGEGKYIYCIIAVDNPGPLNFGPLGIGGRGDELYTISYKPEGSGLASNSQSHKAIAAVVSNSPIKKYPVARENVIPHERAIEEVMKAYTVLPVRFATIAENEEKVKTILEKDYDRFLDLLENMKGKIELGLKAVFFAKDESSSGGKEDIYDYILEKYKEIKASKEKIQELPLEKTHYQRMEIGRMVESALENEKKACKDDILSILSPLAIETKINSNYGERMIINAAFLVGNNREEEFDRKIQEIDVKYGDKVKFKYVGMLPPFNFVNLVIDTAKY